MTKYLSRAERQADLGGEVIHNLEEQLGWGEEGFKALKVSLYRCIDDHRHLSVVAIGK